MDEILNILREKGFRIINDNVANASGKIKFYISEDNVDGWVSLIERLNFSHGEKYKLEISNLHKKELDKIAELEILSRIQVDEKSKEETIELFEAINLEEYKTIKQRIGMRKLDFKPGITCNNNCIHCAIKENVNSLKQSYPNEINLNIGQGTQCSIDKTYEQAIEILKEKIDNYDSITITGGEPTIRKDFISIIKWLYYNKPYIKLLLQTNGRQFSNIDLVGALRRYTRSIEMYIALHGMEETHNKVVNNTRDNGNPFKETVQGLRNLLEMFPNKDIKIVMIVTSLNIDDVFECIKFQHEQLKINNIIFIYPDFPRYPEDEIKKLVPEAMQYFNIVKKINEYLDENPNLKVTLGDDIPVCFYNQLGAKINVTGGNFYRNIIETNFIGQHNEIDEKYYKTYFCKSDKCVKCIFNTRCIGIYEHSFKYRESLINPVTRITTELNKLLLRSGYWR